MKYHVFSAWTRRLRIGNKQRTWRVTMRRATLRKATSTTQHSLTRRRLKMKPGFVYFLFQFFTKHGFTLTRSVCKDKIKLIIGMRYAGAVPTILRKSVNMNDSKSYQH